ERPVGRRGSARAAERDHVDEEGLVARDRLGARGPLVARQLAGGAAALGHGSRLGAWPRERARLSAPHRLERAPPVGTRGQRRAAPAALEGRLLLPPPGPQPRPLGAAPERHAPLPLGGGRPLAALERHGLALPPVGRRPLAALERHGLASPLGE